MSGHSLAWPALLALGAAHGINPAMGWLFAVARGLQERDRRALYRALGPLALGHTVAIATSVLAALTLGRVLPWQVLRWCVAAALAAVGVDGLVRHRHLRLGGMRVGAWELAVWSFLVASVHGAGLMVLPFVLRASAPPAAAMLHHHHAASGVGGPASGLAAMGLAGIDPIGLAAPLIHTAGYLAATTAIAAVVYEKVGLGILRRAWINLNVLWAAALIGAGAMMLLL